MEKELKIDFLSLFKKFQINNNAQSELDKLKYVVKQIYSEIQNLKDEKIKIEEKFRENECDLKKEIADLKKEYAELANKIADQPQIATEEQLSKIDELTKEIDALDNTLHEAKLKLNETNLNCEIIQKQILKYEEKIATDEKEITGFDDGKHRLNIQRKKILELQEIIRIKNRKIDEMVFLEQTSTKEINKMNQILQELEKPKQFDICKNADIEIKQNVINYVKLNEDILLRFRQEGIIFENEKEYILSLPQMIDELQQKNNELMKNSSIYKHKCAKLQVIKPTTDGMPSIEKMKEALLKIKKSNDSKAKKIDELKQHVIKQNNVLQELKKTPPPRLIMINLLREIIRKLCECSESERKNLASQAFEFIETLSK